MPATSSMPCNDAVLEYFTADILLQLVNRNVIQAIGVGPHVALSLLHQCAALCKKPSIRYCIFLRIFCVYHQYTKVSAYFKYPLVYFMNPRATIIHSAYS